MGKSTPVKQAVLVFGALAFGWVAIEMAFKPFRDKARAAVYKSDLDRDPEETALRNKDSDSETNDVVEGKDDSRSLEAYLFCGYRRG